MKPFITHRKEFFIAEKTYAFYNRIDKLYLKAGIFRNTFLDLTSEVLNSDPLIIGFKSSTSVLGYNFVYLNPKLQAEFHEAGGQTKVIIEIKSSPFWLIPICVLFISFTGELLKNSLSLWNIFFYIVAFSAFVGLDVFLKYSLLGRVERLIQH